MPNTNPVPGQAPARLDPAARHPAPWRHFASHNIVIVVVGLFLVGMGWFFTERMRIAIIASAIGAYQETEAEIVRSVARSIRAYVAVRIQSGTRDGEAVGETEQDIFKKFVEPVGLLESGDAWIYAPDHVVFDVSSDFPDTYRGRSMAEIFAIQKLKGASHYEQMTDAVMSAREGSGWYVWLPAKGPEIAAWTPIHVGPFVWTVGLSTPLKEILASTGAERQIRNTREVMSGVTVLSLALLAIWILAEIRRMQSEGLVTTQKDISLALGSVLSLEEGLELCASTVSALQGNVSVAVYLEDERSAVLGLRSTWPRNGSPSIFPSEWKPDEAMRQRLADAAAFRTELPVSRGGTVTVEMASVVDRGVPVGCIARAISRRGRARGGAMIIEAAASVLGNTIGRLRMEESMRDGERRFRSVVDTAADGIVVTTGPGLIDFWNPAAESLFGKPAQGVRGLPLTDFVVTRAVEQLDDQAGTPTVHVGRRADGTEFPVGISSAEWSTRDGVLTTHIIRDISERAAAERERWELRERLQRAERMESLGILAGGVAHDLNNILTPIVGYTDLLLSETAEGDPSRESLVEVYRSARRAGAVVQDLLTLGRRGSFEMAPLDLNDVVRDRLSAPGFTEALVRATGVTVDHQLSPGLGTVRGSQPHLATVVLNLLLNGLEDMPAGGSLTVSTCTRDLDARLQGYEPIDPGRWTVLTVSDTGPGIDPRDLERIFEPFYTKKKMGRSGSGLGLAVVYGVVHDHGGRIDVSSPPGGGTRFSLWLPVSAEHPASRAAAAGGMRGNETVLIVDDRPALRDVAQRMLRRFGYAVTTAESGRAAVEIMKERPADIVVLDMIMEEDFDGLDCYRELVALRPGQKAIIVSGFAETDRVQEAQRLGAGGFLRKPYSGEELAAAVRRELDRSR